MTLPSSILGLPTSLLLLLAAQVTNVHAETQRLPTAIRKMGTDAGEKFTHEYFAFGDQDGVVQAGNQTKTAVPAQRILTAEEEALLAANSSALMSYRAPFAAHFYGSAGALNERYRVDPWEAFQKARKVKAMLEKRDFACPTGTSSCSAIGYPNSCCQSGETCVLIEDTGLGPVGCCPSGESCTGTIACTGDQQGCSSNSGGGCCIPGWSCASVGCTQSSTATATVVISSSTASQVTTTSSSSSSDSTTSQTASSTTSTTSTTTVTSSTGDASAPVRPTSGSTTSTISGFCPTGFYACSAVYGGGCCQTGRDCQTTSCPSTAYTTIISSGVTIAVPATDVTATATTGACAGGWSLCPTDAGPTAGCCPSGYSCGTASCFLATGSATASLAKEVPDSSAARQESRVGYLAIIPGFVGFAFGVALI